jgi:glucose/arabinose dehydrogenase
MRRSRLLLVPLLLLAACTAPAVAPPPAGGEFTLELVAAGLSVPWSIGFLPDGSIIFTERGGAVTVLDPAGGRSSYRVEHALEWGEGGLLGLAVSPAFVTDRTIYLYYTYADTTGRWNRVTRRTLDGGLGPEEVLLDHIPGAWNHDGGRLAFGPDGKLYVTTGDAARPELARDPGSLAGKILRMEPDGSIPADNPFGTLVWSSGHRNPQGLAWHGTGVLYAAEHGPTAHDEVNMILAGQDYGWPQACGSQEPGTAEPIRCYAEFTLAPAGIAFRGNDLYIAGLRGSQLRRIVLGEDGRIQREDALLGEHGRIRDVVLGPAGDLYVSTSNRDGRGSPRPGDDRILRLRFSQAPSGKA